MKPEAASVAQKRKQVPHFRQEPLNKWLEQGVNEDILEKVPEDGLVSWCPPYSSTTKVCRNIVRQTGAEKD